MQDSLRGIKLSCRELGSQQFNTKRLFQFQVY